MKIRRYKKVSKYLSFYRAHFGFHPPYQVVIDGLFCQKALENKVNLNEQIPKYLGDQVKMFTTLCVINETQELGEYFTLSVSDLWNNLIAMGIFFR